MLGLQIQADSSWVSRSILVVRIFYDFSAIYFFSPGNRTGSQIRDKMSRKYQVSEEKRKGLFTIEEDRLLRSLVLKYGIKSWAFIAKKMKTRDRTQCRHRYRNIMATLKQGKIKKFNLKETVQNIVRKSSFLQDLLSEKLVADIPNARPGDDGLLSRIS